MQKKTLVLNFFLIKMIEFSKKNSGRIFCFGVQGLHLLTQLKVYATLCFSLCSFLSVCSWSI